MALAVRSRCDTSMCFLLEAKKAENLVKCLFGASASFYAREREAGGFFFVTIWNALLYSLRRSTTPVLFSFPVTAVFFSPKRLKSFLGLTCLREGSAVSQRDAGLAEEEIATTRKRHRFDGTRLLLVILSRALCACAPLLFSR